MNLRRIKAILWQELYVTLRSGEIFADIFVFPFANIVVFGFLSVYLASENPTMGQLVIMGMLLWQIIWIVQYSVTLGSLWNIWSRNLTNIFITPITLGEYITAHTLSGMAKAIVVVGIAAILSIFIFDFNLFSIGVVSLVLIFVNFSLFAYALGVVLLGLIFRYGTRIQAAAWATVGFLQPLVAAVYPLEVMPTLLQYAAQLFPATHVFEAARYALQTGGGVSWSLFSLALGMNLLYCLFCGALFHHLHRRSLDTGQFSRNEA